jgi:hypothetical protein
MKVIKMGDVIESGKRFREKKNQDIRQQYALDLEIPTDRSVGYYAQKYVPSAVLGFGLGGAAAMGADQIVKYADKMPWLVWIIAGLGAAGGAGYKMWRNRHEK